jgi:2-C-methyl-D-erythritol 4-phosphate cytidylyltransferase/2-C-methyl-D-erythritol 2,4-cyclodiphosphate synthase|tara:strand:+ start:2569 stop:3768 length:1200 start_codon:yes stop_codon:yes gene_type:complete
LKENKNNICIILLAGGIGSRFNRKKTKQLIKINNKSILEICIENLKHSFKNIEIQLVSNKNNINEIISISKKYNLLEPVVGGKERQDSVYSGLVAIYPHFPEYVLIHDSARPIISRRVVKELLNSVKNKPICVIPIIPINDAMRVVNENQEIIYIDKKNHFLVQTPQLCCYKELLLAHQNTNKIYEDESSILISMGKKINTIKGDTMSLKITYENDLKILEPHLNNRNNVTKIGVGFDIHRFDTKKIDDEENFITLGGIKIKNLKSLIGHSDADALLHAITDSILGVINCGDIGLLFPPSDKKWKNFDSSYFLNQAAILLKEKSGKIINIDAVVICEKPKILDYSNQIKERIGNILKINPNRISIKGKTSENVGFIGREEGIAVIANTSIQIIDDIDDD